MSRPLGESLVKGSAGRLIAAHVGQRIRQTRQLAGVSTEQLARTLGTSVDEINRYESGNEHVSPARLLSLSNLFDVPISMFFEGLEAAETARTHPAASPTLPDPVVDHAHRAVSDDLARRAMSSAFGLGVTELRIAEPGSAELGGPAAEAAPAAQAARPEHEAAAQAAFNAFLKIKDPALRRSLLETLRHFC